MRKLETRRLTSERIAQVYPLIQAALPEVTLEDWQAFAAPLVAPEAQPDAGIITVASEQGYIAGLCSYRIEHLLEHGSALNAEHFLVLDLFDQETVVHALAEAVESLARERHCTAVHTNLADTDTRKASSGWMARQLGGRGHRIEGRRLCKVLV
jgi:hypothetical protein